MPAVRATRELPPRCDLTQPARPLLSAQNGHTPLLLAAEAGHTEVVQALLEAGAETETGTKVCMLWHRVLPRSLVLQPRPLIPHRLPQAGLTPYLASCMHDHAATAEALLVGGAKPDAADVRACPRSRSASRAVHLPAANGRRRVEQPVQPACLTSSCCCCAEIQVHGNDASG